MGELNNALGFRLRVLEQVIARNFSRHMGPLEITPTLYSILVLVAANPLCRQTELAKTLDMHQPNLVDRVSLLIKRGLLARQDAVKDRRANTLELTPAGRRFMEKLDAAHKAHLADLGKLLGAENYKRLLVLIPLSYR